MIDIDRYDTYDMIYDIHIHMIHMIHLIISTVSLFSQKVSKRFFYGTLLNLFHSFTLQMEIKKKTVVNALGLTTVFFSPYLSVGGKVKL